MSPRVVEMKVPYTVVKSMKTTKAREKLTETYAEFSKAQAIYAPHSNRLIPTQAQSPHLLSKPFTTLQRLLPLCVHATPVSAPHWDNIGSTQICPLFPTCLASKATPNGGPMRWTKGLGIPRCAYEFDRSARYDVDGVRVVRDK